MNSKTGTLYIVATPIGNFSDFGIRAVAILSDVELILAEDTRHAGKLLTHYGIATRTRSYHDHNEQVLAVEIIALLQEGQDIALISDAGTPLISDPGYRLVKLARERVIPVSPIPGPSALISALSASGLATDRFYFEGFLPAKKSQRIEKLTTLHEEKATLIFYESSHRIMACLEDMSAVFGVHRRGTVARELSKKFESFYHGELAQIINQMEQDPNSQKGEFVVILTGNPDGDKNWSKACQLARQLLPHLSASQTCRIVAGTFSVSKNNLYDYVVGISSDNTNS